MDTTENERITKCDSVYTATNIKNELDSFTISQAFNKLQRYESLGTVEEFKVLKEKSEPKKPIPSRPLEKGAYINWTCPNCGNMRWSGYYYPPLTFNKICTDCLQTIDWSE